MVPTVPKPPRLEAQANLCAPPRSTSRRNWPTSSRAHRGGIRRASTLNDPEVAPVALLVDLLQHLMEERGSDLLVKVGSAPCIRRDGKLIRTTLPAMSPAEIEALALDLLTHAKAAEFG